MGASRHTASFIRSIFFPEITDVNTGTDDVSVVLGTNKSITDDVVSLDTLLVTVQPLLNDQNLPGSEDVIVQVIVPISVADVNGIVVEDVIPVILYDIQISDDGLSGDLVGVFHVFSEIPDVISFSPSMRAYLLRKGKTIQPGMRSYLRNEMGNVQSFTVVDESSLNVTTTDFPSV